MALRYFCFSCRKRQISLNEIQKICLELTNKFDILSKKLENQDSGIEKIVQDKLDNFEKKFQSSTNKTFADVLKGQLLVPTDNVVSITTTDESALKRKTDEEGGLLRSGKRRKLTTLRTKASMNVSGTPAPPLKTPIASLEMHKPKAITKIEQTVSFKPKCTQSFDVTKRDIQSKLDPISFAVKEVRCRKTGEVSVRCDTKDSAEKMTRTAIECMSEKYEIEMLKAFKPRIKIIGFSDEIDEDELLVKLKKQNEIPETFEMKIIRLLKNDKWKFNPMSAIIETDAPSFEHLMKLRRVNIGWERCNIVEVIDVLRCFKCSEYGHKASSCSKPVCCPKCAEGHEAKDCDSNFEKCVNCENFNKVQKLPPDEQVDFNHSSWSSECPLLQKRVKRARQRIDYAT